MTEVTAEMIERGRGADPKIAAERRRVALKVREAREKLTSSGTGHRAFDVELLRLFAQARKTSLPMMAALGIVTASVSTAWVSPPLAILWFGFELVALCFFYALSKKFLAKPLPTIDVRRWRRRFVLAETFQGTIWGWIVLLLGMPEDPAARTFMLVSLLLIGGMNATVTASIPAAVYGSLTPLTIAILFFIRPSSIVDNASLLAALAFGTQLYFILLSRKLHKNAYDTFSFRAEKDALIAELEQATANSDLARRRAEEANLAKSRFLATMSHELRTPLNAILGFSEVMKSELFGAHVVASYKEYSNDIHSSGEHLLMLINEILDLSRVEAGRYDLREEPVSLAHVVEECRHLLALRAKKRDITIQDSMELELPRIWADERAVRQVALNLLSNAIKFTPQGGTITVKVGWTGAGGQYFAIRDTGPGIPEEEIPVVMSSFGRGTLAQKNAEEGSGLGLPIVKGLVELHGGTFTIKSKVREGTEVIVILPSERVMNVLPLLDPQSDEPDPADNRPKRRPRSVA